MSRYNVSGLESTRIHKLWVFWWTMQPSLSGISTRNPFFDSKTFFDFWHQAQARQDGMIIIKKMTLISAAMHAAIIFFFLRLNFQFGWLVWLSLLKLIVPNSKSLNANSHGPTCHYSLKFNHVILIISSSTLLQRMKSEGKFIRTEYNR